MSTTLITQDHLDVLLYDQIETDTSASHWNTPSIESILYSVQFNGILQYLSWTDLRGLKCSCKSFYERISELEILNKKMDLFTICNFRQPCSKEHHFRNWKPFMMPTYFFPITDNQIAHWRQFRYNYSSFTFVLYDSNVLYLVHPQCTLLQLYQRLIERRKKRFPNWNDEDRLFITVGPTLSNSFFYDESNPVLIESVFQPGIPICFANNDHSILYCQGIALYDWTHHNKTGIRVRIIHRKQFTDIRHPIISRWRCRDKRYYYWERANLQKTLLRADGHGEAVQISKALHDDMLISKDQENDVPVNDTLNNTNRSRSWCICM